MASYTEMSQKITNITTKDQALDALDTILDQWETNVHRANTMIRWQECIKWRERLIDNPDGDVESVKKFLGMCLKGDEASAAKYPIGVDR